MGAFHAFQITQMVQIAQNIVAEITFKETLPIFFLRLLKSEDKEQWHLADPHYYLGIYLTNALSKCDLYSSFF